MIYLKSRKLLFLRPHKTDARKLEIALSMAAGRDDVVTPLELRHELSRLAQGGSLPRNYSSSRLAERLLRAQIRCVAWCARHRPQLAPERVGRSFQRVLGTLGAHHRLSNHSGLSRVARVLGREVFEQATVVTMCRHPYDVLEFRARWALGGRGRDASPDVLSAAIDRVLEEEPLNEDFYFLDGAFVPGFVIRHEHLADDLREAERRFGIELLRFVDFERDVAPNAGAANMVLSAEQKRVCGERNARIFEHFGYAR